MTIRHNLYYYNRHTNTNYYLIVQDPCEVATIIVPSLLDMDYTIGEEQIQQSILANQISTSESTVTCPDFQFALSAQDNYSFDATVFETFGFSNDVG